MSIGLRDWRIGSDQRDLHESLNYHMTLGERIHTPINSTWHTMYFSEPMLSLRRSARRVRRLLRGD
jgi:hypothetical protein